jgi:hypothetical protein
MRLFTYCAFIYRLIYRLFIGTFHFNFIFRVLGRTWIFLFSVMALEPTPPGTVLGHSGEYAELWPSVLAAGYCSTVIFGWCLIRISSGTPAILTEVSELSFSPSIRGGPLPSRSLLIHHPSVLPFSAVQSSQLQRLKITCTM